ncbi:POK9 protein, partial [Pelecanoides urinatrix]|nr:POK9 protein [Pelecanoides urinatrix]
QHRSLPTPLGKRESQRVHQPPRPDTSSCCQHLSPASLQPATAGSLGLDVAAAAAVTLMTTQPEKVPTGIKGPIIIDGLPMGALLLGRSSATMMGLFVLPGVIDADYTGEIYVMVHTLFPPIQIEKGQRIAQLIPLEQMAKTLPPRQTQSRGERGFGSTGGLTLLTMNLNDRPKRTVILDYRSERQTLEGLLDTGADSSIVSPDFWPHNWPLQPTTVTVTRVGGLTLARKSPMLSVTIDGKTLWSVFSIVPLPPTVQCLIGRDILAQMGVVL